MGGGLGADRVALKAGGGLEELLGGVWGLAGGLGTGRSVELAGGVGGSRALAGGVQGFGGDRFVWLAGGFWEAVRGVLGDGGGAWIIRG